MIGDILSFHIDNIWVPLTRVQSAGKMPIMCYNYLEVKRENSSVRAMLGVN